MFRIGFHWNTTNCWILLSFWNAVTKFQQQKVVWCFWFKLHLDEQWLTYLCTGIFKIKLSACVHVGACAKSDCALSLVFELMLRNIWERFIYDSNCVIRCLLWVSVCEAVTLSAVSTFVNTLDDEYNENENDILFSLLNSWLVFFLVC